MLVCLVSVANSAFAQQIASAEALLALPDRYRVQILPDGTVVFATDALKTDGSNRQAILVARLGSQPFQAIRELEGSGAWHLATGVAMRGNMIFATATGNVFSPPIPADRLQCSVMAFGEPSQNWSIRINGQQCPGLVATDSGLLVSLGTEGYLPVGLDGAHISPEPYIPDGSFPRFDGVLSNEYRSVLGVHFGWEPGPAWAILQSSPGALDLEQIGGEFGSLIHLDLAEDGSVHAVSERLFSSVYQSWSADGEQLDYRIMNGNLSPFSCRVGDHFYSGIGTIRLWLADDAVRILGQDFVAFGCDEHIMVAVRDVNGRSWLEGYTRQGIQLWSREIESIAGQKVQRPIVQNGHVALITGDPPTGTSLYERVRVRRFTTNGVPVGDDTIEVTGLVMFAGDFEGP